MRTFIWSSCINGEFDIITVVQKLNFGASTKSRQMGSNNGWSIANPNNVWPSCQLYGEWFIWHRHTAHAPNMFLCIVCELGGKMKSLGEICRGGKETRNNWLIYHNLLPSLFSPLKSPLKQTLLGFCWH